MTYTLNPGTKMVFQLATTVVAGTAKDAPLRYEYTVGDDVTGWVQQDARGQHNSNDHAFKPGKAPKIGPPVSPASGIANTIVPLPDEPIGVGATWAAELTAKMPNATYSQTNTYKLVSLDKKVAKIQIAQSAQTSFAKPLQMPVGGKPALMVGNRISGSGEATVDLGQLVANGYKLTTKSESLFQGPNGELMTNAALPATSIEFTVESKSVQVWLRRTYVRSAAAIAARAQ